MLPRRGIDGMVHIASKVAMKKNTERKIKDARQLKYLVMRPEDMLPNIKPMGFDEPNAPVARFLRLPSGYVANIVPIAGGEMRAVPIPSMPQKTFKGIAAGAKAVPRDQAASHNMPTSSCGLQPKRSAVLPNMSMKEPLPRLHRIRT